MQPTSVIKIRTPAKINLALQILGLRADGYHELTSVMQTVSIYDELLILPRQQEGITLSSDLPFLPIDGRNLVTKAALLFFEHIGMHRYGVEIRMKKRIPVGAGMGGGSTNAAGTLVALNRMTQAGLSQQELMELGRELGADVPFCIHRGTCLATGVGDVLTPLADFPRCTLVIAKPRRSISTASLYRRYDDHGTTVHPNVQALVNSLNRPLLEIAAHCGNSLQEAAIAEVPQIGDLLQTLRKHGALCAVMTGSGSAVFGIFPHNAAAQHCTSAMRVSFPGCFISPAAVVGAQAL